MRSDRRTRAIAAIGAGVNTHTHWRRPTKPVYASSIGVHACLRRSICDPFTDSLACKAASNGSRHTSGDAARSCAYTSTYRAPDRCPCGTRVESTCYNLNLLKSQLS
jgi:hypothetical protein